MLFWVKTFFVVLLSVFCLDAAAQSNKVHAIENVSAIRLQQSGIQTFDNRARGVEGTYLLFDNWKRGRIVTVASGVFDVAMLNFYVSSNEILIRSKGQDYVLPRMAYQSFTVEEIDAQGEVRTRVFEQVLLPKKQLAVVEVLAGGNAPLYKQYSHSIQKANYRPGLDVGSLNDKIIVKPVYYLSYKDKIYELPKRRKKAEKQFARFKKISSYLKTNKVDMKNEQDLIQFSNYLNNL